MPIHLENSIFTFIMSQIPQSYSHNVQLYYVRVGCAIAQLLRFALCVGKCLAKLSSLPAKLPW